MDYVDAHHYCYVAGVGQYNSVIEHDDVGFDDEGFQVGCISVLVPGFLAVHGRRALKFTSC